MTAIIFYSRANPNAERVLARPYWAEMVDSRQVRVALRQLRLENHLEPEEFADAAKVDRSTVYRIEKLDVEYSPKIETVSALAESQGLTLSAFFLRIEGGDQPIHTGAGTTSSIRHTLTFTEELSVAFLEAASATARASLRGLLTDIAYAFTESGKARQQAPAPRDDAPGRAQGDRSAG